MCERRIVTMQGGEEQFRRRVEGACTMQTEQMLNERRMTLNNMKPKKKRKRGENQISTPSPSQLGRFFPFPFPFPFSKG